MSEQALRAGTSAAIGTDRLAGVGAWTNLKDQSVDFSRN